MTPAQSAPKPIVSPSATTALGWGIWKISIVFFAGGILLSLVADLLLLAVSLLVDAVAYPNEPSNAVRLLIGHAPFSAYLIFALIPYVKAQFVNTLVALLSYLILRRVSFWLMMIAVPVVAFGFGFSFSVEWFWQLSRPAMSLTKFLALAAFQAAVTIACLVLMRFVMPGRSEPVEKNAT